jgi:hypothetical protein
MAFCDLELPYYSSKQPFSENIFAAFNCDDSRPIQLTFGHFFLQLYLTFGGLLLSTKPFMILANLLRFS